MDIEDNPRWNQDVDELFDKLKASDALLVSKMGTLWKILTRKKVLSDSESSEVGRALNTFDLTTLGVGSTLGVGIYVIAGQVARDVAGPAVILSFLIAAVASLLAGLCYAEFGARVPRTGSAYIYSYVCVGEIIAFIIGWNLILEYVIGSASAAKGISLYLDVLTDNTLRDTFKEIAPIDVTFMSPYFDFFAFGISVILAVALAFGLKKNSWVNNVLTVFNISIIIFIITAGSTQANRDNWHVTMNNSDDSTVGEGGFFPFGVEGMVKGAAICFYSFVGFECIATAGQEVKNPRKTIPFAMIFSLFVTFLAYFGTSIVLTFMVPYYDQDKDIPIPHAFLEVHLDWVKWIVVIGAICALSVSLFGATFPLPRIIHAMSSDGVIFQFLGKVNQRFETPVTGTLIAGLLISLMSALFELKQLVTMMSIGTLLAYTVVAASVLLLRYSRTTGGLDGYEKNKDSELKDGDDARSRSFLRQIFNSGCQNFPCETSEAIVKTDVCLYCILCVLIGLCSIYWKNEISDGKLYAVVLTAIVVSFAVFIVISLYTQPKSRTEPSFKVPLVPLIPALSILINIYFMLMLDKNTWIRFGIWMAVGLPIYYVSVKTHPDARNEDISTVTPKKTGNGYVNHSYVNDETIIEDEFKKKSPAPQPPTDKKIEETIASLDEILESAEADVLVRKFSADSVSNVSNILREENVQADVHRSAATSDQQDLPHSHPDSVSIPTPESGVAVSPADSPTPQTSLHDENDLPDHEASGRNVFFESGSDSGADETATDVSDRVESTIPLSPVKTEEVIPSSMPPPPPPPQLADDLTSNSVQDAPRPTIRMSALISARLKPVEKTENSPNDHSLQSTEVSESNGNLKFGSPQYKEFIEKLDLKLQENIVLTQLVSNLNSTPLIDDSTSHIPNENVIEDNIDRNETKRKLTELLERTNNLPRGEGHKSEKNNTRNKWNNIKRDEEHDKETHRQNMQSIFRSVRLRKEDSFKENANGTNTNLNANEGVRKPKDDIDLDRIKHQQSMENIFKSIRLKKVDSFKKNESQ